MCRQQVLGVRLLPKQADRIRRRRGPRAARTSSRHRLIEKDKGFSSRARHFTDGTPPRPQEIWPAQHRGIVPETTAISNLALPRQHRMPTSTPRSSFRASMMSLGIMTGTKLWERCRCEPNRASSLLARPRRADFLDPARGRFAPPALALTRRCWIEPARFAHKVHLAQTNHHTSCGGGEGLRSVFFV